MERRTSQQKAPERTEHEERVPPLRLEVLDHMRLVKDHVVPAFALEHMCVAASEGIGRDADIEMVFVVPALTELLALFGVAVIAEHLETGQELLELHLPVQQHARRHDDQVRPPDPAVARQVGEQGDGLDSLPAERVRLS